MKISKKIKRRLTCRQRKAIAWHLKKILWGVVAFVFSLSSVMGACSPFAVSLIAVSEKSNFLFAFAGASIGYVLFSPPAEGIRYFSAVLISTLGVFLMNLQGRRQNALIPMAVSFLSVASTGVVMNIAGSARASEYALVISEAILASGGCFFFFKTLAVNVNQIKLRALSPTELTCMLASVSLLLSCLSSLEIGGISPARIFSVFIILSAVRFASQKTALIISLCLGFALGISEENSLFLIGAYAFSALLSSLFTSASSLGVGLCFTLSTAFFAVSADMGAFSLCCVFESLAAAIILALLPLKLTQKISELFDSRENTVADGSIRQSLTVRLRFAAAALNQVSESVREVREKINSISAVGATDSELRTVAADQFFSIADMLEDLAFEFDEAQSFDFQAAGRIRKILAKYNIFPINICVVEDKFGRSRVEILAPKNARLLDSGQINEEISRACRREFDSSSLSTTSAGKLLSLCERPNYKMSVGFSQYCAEGNLCGDTIKTINDSKGHMILIISDGMGKGKRAALDGAMGAGLLSKLLCAGFGFDSSLKVVNSALLVKSSDESLATLDCACIDLFTGKCELYKAGAPATYIIKNKRLTKCELSSMPAGILRGIEFAKRTTVLGVGDEIIMLSDGITDIGAEPLERFIAGVKALDPNEKAKSILDFALENSNERRRDDMSVIVARLLAN